MVLGLGYQTLLFFHIGATCHIYREQAFSANPWCWGTKPSFYRISELHAVSTQGVYSRPLGRSQIDIYVYKVPNYKQIGRWYLKQESRTYRLALLAVWHPSRFTALPAWWNVHNIYIPGVACLLKDFFVGTYILYTKSHFWMEHDRCFSLLDFLFVCGYQKLICKRYNVVQHTTRDALTPGFTCCKKKRKQEKCPFFFPRVVFGQH